MIDTAALGLALGAGLVAALNPCGFAFLPGYLALVIAGGGGQRSRPAALARAGLATTAMAAGFVTVFGVFGLAISPLIASAQRYLPFGTVLIGVLLIGLGGWLLSGRDVTVMLPTPSGGTPGAGLGSMYGYGVGYALASLSCTIAPFLAAVSTTFQQGAWLTGVLAFVCYALGMAVTVGVAAVAVALAGASAAGALRAVLPYINRIVGALVLVTGLYVTYYGYYEIRLFFTDAGPDDPVIEAAGAMQGWLAGIVDTLGVWPLLGALALLVAVGVGRRLAPRALRSSPAISGETGEVAVTDENEDPSEFWEQFYGETEQKWSGRVNARLVEVAGDLTPGRALDLGCGEGADAVWLAEHGWQVTAVDISATALDRARTAAAERDLLDRIIFEEHELPHTFPGGRYDLVSAQFLHSPVRLDRVRTLRRAADAVDPGGVLLIVDHGAAPPWVEDPDAHHFDTPEAVLAALDLADTEWERLRADTAERDAVSPDGEPAMLSDNVIVLRRRG